MKSLMVLWQVVAEELGDRCCASTIRDIKTVSERSEHEGSSFFTITLPSFGKDFEKSLDQGYVTHDQFKAFAFTGGLPRFLGGFLELIFDRCDGSLLAEPDIEAIFAVRQLTLMFAKILLPCSDARVRKALSGYVEIEQQVRTNDAEMPSFLLDEFSYYASLLWSDVFANVDSDIAYGRLIPKHGPGATAERLRPNGRYAQSEWTERLDRVFPSSDYMIPNYRYSSYLDRVKLLEPGTERPVRVITVPKTLKTPRIIAIEPACMQYTQQGILEALIANLESPSLNGRKNIPSWLLGFSDQDPNRRMAHEGSSTKSLATLDLSEASDRVSNQLVRRLLRRHPHLHEGVDGCRSRSAEVPGHGVIRLAKFASMGSALCFPFEAMVFATVIFVGISRALGRRLTLRDITSFEGTVRVYGDDIIVPTHFARSVVDALELFGFKVNVGKSFWTGSFRESCGREYYAGHDVSIVKVRELLPSQRTDVRAVVSTVSLRNQMYFAGLWKTAAWLDSRLQGVLKYFPTVHPDSPVLGRHTVLGYQTDKQCKHLHRPLVKGYAVVGKPPRDLLDGEMALLKWFLKRGEEPFADKDHLERQGRPKHVDIKLGWHPPY